MIHVFNIKDLYFTTDTSTGLVHAVDKIVFDLLMNEKFKDENKYSELYNEYGESTVREALSEIQYLIDNKMLYTEDIKYVNTIKPVIKAMCLNMTPVSYTHLDVYKRQHQEPIRLLQLQ